MQKSIYKVAFMLTACALAATSALAQTPEVYGFKDADQAIGKTHKKSMKRDEICFIAYGVGKAAWHYKEENKPFPFEKMNGNSPFFPLYFWAYNYGTFQASVRYEAGSGAYDMCVMNAHRTYRAWEAGRPLELSELKCSSVVVPIPGCR